MRRLCRREWNWQAKLTKREPHSWDPRQRTTWSQRIKHVYNYIKKTLVLYVVHDLYVLTNTFIIMLFSCYLSLFMVCKEFQFDKRNLPSRLLLKTNISSPFDFTLTFQKCEMYKFDMVSVSKFKFDIWLWVSFRIWTCSPEFLFNVAFVIDNLAFERGEIFKRGS